MKSLKSKILIYLTLPTIILISLIIFIVAQSSFKLARDQAEALLRQDAKVISSEIERQNDLAIRTAKLMVLAQEEALFGKRDLSNKYAQRILTEFPEYTGAYFGYEPNEDGLDARYTGDQYAGKTTDENGRFLPYWYRGENGNMEVAPLIDMESSLYYDGVRKLFVQSKQPQGLVTEPYIYEGQMIVEQTYPITDGSQFQGIAGVDRALASIDTLLQDIKAKTSVDVFLLSRDKHFISSTTPTSELNTKALNDTKYRTLFSSFINSKDLNNVLLESDPFDGQNYYFASSPVGTGEWTVIIRQSEDQVIGGINALFLSMSIFAFIGVLLLIGLSMWFVTNISRRVNDVMTVAEKIANGDLDTIKLVEDTSGDELSVMSKSLSNVVSSYTQINSICSAIASGDYSKEMVPRSANDQVAVSINYLSQRRQEVEQQLTERSQQIQSNTERQYTEIETVASSMNEMTSTITEVSNLASNSADSAVNIVGGLSNAQNALANALSEVESLSTDISSVSDAISEVATSSDNISSIVEVINTIAEQTNLLALNAAIEAARAGEQGRGFAVVADEVRSLASKTSASTEEIRTLISQLHAGVNNSVEKVTTGVTKAQFTVEKTQEASNSLADMEQKITAISDQMTQIAAAVEQQSITCEEVNLNITSINDAASDLAKLASS